MPYSERDIRELLGDDNAHLVEAEDISFPRETVARGSVGVADAFSDWLAKGAPGAPLPVSASSLQSLGIELHRYPRADVLEILDRTGERRLSLRPLRGEPDVGLVGDAGSLAYVRHKRDGDACAVAFDSNTIVLERSSAGLRVALIRAQAQMASPPIAELRRWMSETPNVTLHERAIQLLDTGGSWNAVVVAALLSHQGGIRVPRRPVRQVANLRAASLAEQRPVDWMRSLTLEDARMLEQELQQRASELRSSLELLRMRDDELSEVWCADYSRRAWQRAELETVGWLLRQRPDSQILSDAWDEVDRAGEATRPVMEELLMRDDIVAAVASLNPGSWWDAGTRADAVE